MTRGTRFYQAACILLMLAIANISICSEASAAQDTSPASDDDLAAEFKDKIVLLEVNRSSALESKSNSVALQKVRITKIGNRYFVLGVGYAPNESDEYWHKDMLVGVPWDSVLRFHAMTQKQFDAYIKQWEERYER